MFWVSSYLNSGNNFNFFGSGVLEPNSRTGVFWRIWSKNSGSLAGWCITDSLSHTTYVETNKQSDILASIRHRVNNQIGGSSPRIKWVESHLPCA